MPEGIKNWYLKLITPLIEFFIRLELNPNFFTTIGFILTIGAAVLFAVGQLVIAGAIVLLAGTFDIIDGKVARATNRVTKFGALYDSTLDRYSEVIMFFGLAFYFVRADWFLTSVAVSFALGGSIMVSYVRARAEALGFHCKVGIMQRPERVVYIGFGALFSFIHIYILIFAICLIAVFANVTAVQRIYHIWVAENGKKKQKLGKTELDMVGE
ncbi:CDP-alcohol phosphatidyltransferase family protein [candidate division KSB1 bacterium]|nr:CDP-alcohol phosphatidyltransferase family protein [candidate division KSB1 bacterium]NIR69958.1 CDP-alcohol phosphatidyltransferase family protein [candidate division KSB1 bacterium]NIS25857.1 CDP-alcohol phosphatidyltransferase family protein [candidate division KSB1 bacterium]NIT72734.1 CDP-alcohol phosphatidyltransferase family protein [candidate division KSB1 bacterium]NIU26546.1 CDP-alcohol phosphatidyltransferase family protein [candidate division KSB1 bacterium]